MKIVNSFECLNFNELRVGSQVFINDDRLLECNEDLIEYSNPAMYFLKSIKNNVYTFIDLSIDLHVEYDDINDELDINACLEYSDHNQTIKSFLKINDKIVEINGCYEEINHNSNQDDFEDFKDYEMILDTVIEQKKINEEIIIKKYENSHNLCGNEINTANSVISKKLSNNSYLIYESQSKIGISRDWQQCQLFYILEFNSDISEVNNVDDFKNIDIKLYSIDIKTKENILNKLIDIYPKFKKELFTLKMLYMCNSKTLINNQDNGLVREYFNFVNNNTISKIFEKYLTPVYSNDEFDVYKTSIKINEYDKGVYVKAKNQEYSLEDADIAGYKGATIINNQPIDIKTGKLMSEMNEILYKDNESIIVECGKNNIKYYQYDTDMYYEVVSYEKKTEIKDRYSTLNSLM